MRKNKGSQNDEFMDAIAKKIFDQEYEEYEELFETDEQFQQNRYLVENVKYEKKEKKKFPAGVGRFLATAAVVCIVFTIVVPVAEANAWRIWNLGFLFGDHEDHTGITPNIEEDTFPQYYVTAVPDGFDVIFEDTTTTSIIIRYQNQQDQFILYTQVDGDEFFSQLDNEHHDLETEMIGDFETLISANENEQDVIFEAVTDRVAITVQTNAGYDIGKKFIESLKEI